DPDITLRFVERLPLRGGLRYLGLGEAGFTDDSFLVLRGKHGTHAGVMVPFEQIGGPCELVCQTGLKAVPLLIAIVNLTMLAKGVLPLHAAALRYGDTGIVATGWSKGGKTETLLAFAAHGATYIGDEWVYLDADEARVYGIPEPVRVWDWHLRELPELAARLDRSDRARLGALRAAVGLGERLPRRLRQAAARPLRALKRQLHADVAPGRLFGAARCAASAPFDRLIFVGSHASEEVTVRPIDPEEVARRMVFSLEYERLPLTDYYLRFRFAFPQLRNELIEGAEELQRQLLLRALEGKRSHAVYHPYPVTAAALFSAIAPLVRP
ncbi:MAG TPA: hypothetical protein PKD53_27630, partial [Chloroflexaceae bacterium]|nr:hypothetical protein [Chloroflexaceae bacterium]